MPGARVPPKYLNQKQAAGRLVYSDFRPMAVPTFQLFHTLRHDDAPIKLYLDPEGDFMGVTFERGPLFEVLYLVFSHCEYMLIIYRYTPVYPDNLGCRQRSPPRKEKTTEG